MCLVKFQEEEEQEQEEDVLVVVIRPGKEPWDKEQ